MTDRIGWVCPVCGTARPPQVDRCCVVPVPQATDAEPQTSPQSDAAAAANGAVDPVADVVASSSKAQPRKKPKRLDYSQFPLFEEFWNHYPHKRDKASALPAWIAATDAGAEPQMLIAAAAKFAKWCRVNRIEQRHIKYAQRWLAKECWTDELELPLEIGAIDIEAQRAVRIADEQRAIDALAEEA